MATDSNYQYYVEGEDEKKFLEVLRTDLQVIQPGKIQVFNVASKFITKTRLLALKQGTTVVLVFDTDEVNEAILQQNIALIASMPNVSEVLTVLQVRNLEDELVRSCNIKKVEELVNARNKGEFKSRFINISNLAVVLKKNGFDPKKLWRKEADNLKKRVPNCGNKVIHISS